MYYCVTCKKFTKSKNVQTKKTKNNRTIAVGTCVVCNKKKSTFVKGNQKKNLQEVV